MLDISGGRKNPNDLYEINRVISEFKVSFAMLRQFIRK